MINYHNLKQLLLKAVSLTKNRQGLVYVQRVANGPTGTYLVHKWIRPDKVAASDHVLAGHINLPASHPQAPANPKKYTSFSFPYSNAIKQQTTAFFNQMPNVQTFYSVLHNLGIHWNVHATHPGINMMRAKGALNAAIHNGLNLSTLPPQLLGLNNPITMPQTPATPLTPTGGAQVTQPAPQSQTTLIPSTVTQPAVSTQITLTAKAKKASQSAKDKARAFANSFPSRQDFYDALAKMGIQWAVNAHPGINMMRAQEALSLHIESGFDVDGAWAALQNPSTISSPSPAPQTATPVQSAPQPAPQTAAPVQPAPAPPPPTVDNSLLEIPKDATPAQIELIKHINNMTDYKTIRKCAVMGMVPEDDVAAEYITETMLGKLKDWVVGNTAQNTCPSSIVQQFKADMAEIGEPVKKVTKRKPDTMSNSEIIMESLGVIGCRKSMLSSGLHTAVAGAFNMGELIAPHNFIVPIDSVSYQGETVHPLHIVESLTNAYSDYTTDKRFPEGGGKTNLGYTGYNPEEYQQRYDPNKEGLIRFLQKVKQDNAGNVEIAAEVDRMIQDYNEAMKIVGGNGLLLDQLTRKLSWGKQSSYSVYDYKPEYIGNSNASTTSPHIAYDPERLQFIIAGAHAQADALLSVLQSKGYSTKQIVDSIRNISYNDDLSSFRVQINDAGDRDIVNVYSELTDPNTGVNPLSKYGSRMSRGVVSLAMLKLQQQKGLSDADIQGKHYWYNPNEPEQTKQWLKNAQHYVSYTEADAQKVRQLIGGIFKIDSSSPSPAKTVILANMLMAKKFNDAASIVIRQIGDNAKSAQNNNGRNYAGNFDFYDPEYLMGHTARDTNYQNGSYSDTYTVKELSGKITQQLNSAPSYSADYIQKLTQYYRDKATAAGIAPTMENAQNMAHRDMLSNLNLTSGFDPLLDSPIKDVVHKTTVALLSHVPKMAQNPKFQSNLNKKLNYVPYDFSAATQPRLNPPPKIKPPVVDPPVSDDDMKAARQKLFESASMSVGTESEQVSEEMRKDINQNRFDRKAGDKTPDGKVFNGPFHRTAAQDNRCVLYNTRFFAIHNSIWEEHFNKKQAELKAKYPNNPDMWTSMDLFHGTARGCAGNLLGREAGFWMGESTDYQAAGKMLGRGGYFGEVMGKSVVYAGEKPYSNIRYYGGNSPPEGYADGVVIMANVMRGDNYRKNAPTPFYNSSYSSVSTDETRDWEMAVRDNALIFPHHFVDVSCRSYKKNVKVDDQGNYLDDQGNITHDKYGKSVTMK